MRPRGVAVMGASRSVSFCVPVFDEADALRRLVRSTYPFASMVAEWVIVDHRSRDATPAVIEDLRGELRKRHISLTTTREARDFSSSFTFADLRNLLLSMAGSDIVVMADADFVFGPALPALLAKSQGLMTTKETQAVGFARPVIWDRLSASRDGRIRDHGRVWVHKWRPGIMRRKAVTYSQTFGGGRWEDLVASDGGKLRVKHLTKKRQPKRNVLVSVNVKPQERLDLRHTMTWFMRDAVTGAKDGEWLDNYGSGTLARQDPYQFVDLDLRGWKINAPKLRLGYDG